jgi:glycosyltransferase involved in cell wall biosynthesis
MRLKTEQKIIREFGNYGIRVKFLADYLRSNNPNVKLFWYKYPFNINTNLSINHKHPQFDIVFFARISKDKGIEDLITAVEIVKKSKGSVSVKIIGNGNAQYIEYLRKRVLNLHLEKNIEFLGFLATQEELHEVVSNPKICVLPTYNDILPGTIIESLFLKIPVIAYAANGVVDLNFECENIRLVEIGNINELAKQINILLDDELARETLSSRAYQYAIRNFDNKMEAGKMIEAYLKVISDFKNNFQ